MTTTTSGSSESNIFYILAADNYLVPTQNVKREKVLHPCTLVIRKDNSSQMTSAKICVTMF